ncbi:MAG TPA: glycosyltransferase [Candidatus Saccharimonadales bacterium]|nr:glycosyltransferase [Candidatus Saccharimonadales bacterium]
MKCLILSQGPVPAPEHTKVEGGGLRCWGLAKGLRANNQDLEITVAYHESYKKEKFTERYEDIDLNTWEINSVDELISAYDTVIVSYCMGDLSVKVADTIRPDQQLILDCYVPIYVEVSARDSDEVDREFHAFNSDVNKWAHVLKRGDVFLCANEPQRRYYQGVLSGLGRVNPVTYGQELLLVVPYGIYREKPTATEKPITKLIEAGGDAKKILWFGGIYPWFDLRGLVDAVGILNKSLPAKLVIVGAKNPFNDHPDFVRPYNQLIEHIEKTGAEDFVVVQDWIEFDKRADWYLDSDLVVVINKEGEENELSWRTRLVDFLWADLPLLTNGGDPLGESLIANDAAQKLHGLSPEAIAKGLDDTLNNSKRLRQLKRNLTGLKDQYYWDSVTKKLEKSIDSKARAKDIQEYGDHTIVPATPQSTKNKLIKAASKGRMLPAYAKKHGLRSTYYLAKTTAHNQLRKAGLGNRKVPGVVVVAHQLDLSGAPYVLMDLVGAIKQETDVPIDFHTFNPIHKQNILRLNKLKIKPKIHVSKDIAIPFFKGDVAVLNTVAHSLTLKRSVYEALDNGTVEKLVWFIHEDEPEQLFRKTETKKLKKYLSQGKLIMYIAAEKTLANYQKFFENSANIRKQPYKYEIPERFQQVYEQQDFNRLKFLLVGNVADGRKGQLPILYAFKAFLDQYYEKQPELYRDFSLVYVGLTTHDFMSKQIMKHAPKLLGKRFVYHGQVTHERSSQLMMNANVTICYSLRECLPLFVFEGMAAGHPIMRNDSSGMEEQLFVGKNGFYLDSLDFKQVVSQIETIANIKKTSNAKLAEMSKRSNYIARQQAEHSYKPMVEEITGKFRG